jgi:hypothetical protein
MSLDLGLFVQGMLPIPLAVLHKLELFLLSLAVLLRRVIPPLALGTGERNDFYRLFFGSHIQFLSPRQDEPDREKP